MSDSTTLAQAIIGNVVASAVIHSMVNHGATTSHQVAVGMITGKH